MDSNALTDLKHCISATFGQHFTQLQTGFDRVEHRLTGIEEQLNKVEEELSNLKGRLTRLENGFRSVEAHVQEMNVTVEDHIFTYISVLDDQVHEHELKLHQLTQ